MSRLSSLERNDPLIINTLRSSVGERVSRLSSVEPCVRCNPLDRGVPVEEPPYLVGGTSACSAWNGESRYQGSRTTNGNIERKVRRYFWEPTHANFRRCYLIGVIFGCRCFNFAIVGLLVWSCNPSRASQPLRTISNLYGSLAHYGSSTGCNPSRASSPFRTFAQETCGLS